MRALQCKGFTTLGLILISEFVALSNAVTFWSTYQNWSKNYGRGRFDQNTQERKRRGKFGNGDTHTGGSSFPSFERSKSTFEKCNRINSGQEENNIASDIDATTANVVCDSHSLQSQKRRSTSIFPRTRARLASVDRYRGVCSKNMIDCCSSSCPSCFMNTSYNPGPSDTGTSSSFSSSSIGPMPIGIGTMGAVFKTRGGSISTSSNAETTATTTAEAVLASVAITPYGIPLYLWKIIFQIFLTAINVMCWLIPLRSKKISENKLGLSIANAFSGGVFLSLAFGHLIPECIHGFGDHNEALPFMIVLGGYLLIFFVEKVAFDAHGLMHVSEDMDSHEHNKKGVNSHQKGGNEHTIKGQSEINTLNLTGLNTGRSAIILLGALAVHSILEMTALGLADTFGDSALLSLSIALHQPAESIALLVSFLKSGMPKDQIAFYLTIFSGMGPIGVAIGMIVKEFAAPIIDSIMLAVVAGTFVYVGATEVIPEEWEEQEHKWKKFFALISGIVSIFAITQYTMTLEGHSA